MRPASVISLMFLSITLLAGIRCAGPQGASDSERLFKVDSVKIADFAERSLRGPGPVHITRIPRQENFAVAVGIKDGPCKANAGDIIYLAYRTDSSGLFWDCILRIEHGSITKILKINEDNNKAPDTMIKYLLEPNCK